MTILDELLDSVSKLKEDEQLRIICDNITKEEIEDALLYEGPDGANVFLSLPAAVKDPKREHYICLEREAAGAYIISHWTCMINSVAAVPKRVKAWDVKHSDPKKVLQDFAERLTFLKGE